MVYAATTDTPAADLHHIVYRSVVAEALGAPGLDALLTQSRASNRRTGVTGLLLCADDHFMQCLEGPRLTLDALYGRIQADPRHRQIQTLLRADVGTRSFARWDMACSVVDATCWSELCHAQWDGYAARATVTPSPGLMLMQSAWYALGDNRPGEPRAGAGR